MRSIRHYTYCAALMATFVIDNPHCGQYDVNRTQLAATYLESGRYDQALKELRRALREDDDNTTLYLFTALAHMSKGDDTLALKALIDALSIDPTHTDLHNALRDLSRETQRYLEVQSQLEELLIEHPQNAPLLSTLAWTQARQGNDDRAIALFDSATALDPQLLFARLELSRILLEQENYARAESELQAALLIEPTDPQLLIVLGECQLHQGHTSIADSTFQRALENRAATDNGAMAARVAQLYYGHNLQQKTIEYYERALAHNPDNAFVLNNLAWTYAEEGTLLNRATKLSLRSLKIDGANPVYLDTFAELLYMQGQYHHAFAAIRRALELETEEGSNWSYLQEQHEKMRRSLL